MNPTEDTITAIQTTIRDFILSESYTNTTIHYDMNAIKIRMHENYSNKRHIFLYIYAPWRITDQGRIINSSDLCPRETGINENNDRNKAFAYFAGLTDGLCKQRIIDVTIKTRSCDLVMKWHGGAILESLNNNAEEWSYHIYDNINGKTYDVFYGKIN